MPFVGGGIGFQEILLLGLLAALLFGTKNLPKIGRSAAKGIRELKKPIAEVSEHLSLDEVKDVAALARPKTALSRILTDRPGEGKTPAAGAAETDT
jgi:TatA/E family protein of Tat protein translocase